mmetsp:Transcript_828/g.1790  ORF Transcript_828/g.1790 Transcript_828/m.1790 type:complete len:267 (+) Transcript_828:2014-2814(+)
MSVLEVGVPMSSAFRASQQRSCLSAGLPAYACGGFLLLLSLGATRVRGLLRCFGSLLLDLLLFFLDPLPLQPLLLLNPKLLPPIFFLRSADDDALSLGGCLLKPLSELVNSQVVEQDHRPADSCLQDVEACLLFTCDSSGLDVNKFLDILLGHGGLAVVLHQEAFELSNSHWEVRAADLIHNVVHALGVVLVLGQNDAVQLVSGILNAMHDTPTVVLVGVVVDELKGLGRDNASSLHAMDQVAISLLFEAHRLKPRLAFALAEENG